MASLWEDTFVIALRDWQWIKQAQSLSSQQCVSRIYPSAFIKLDGKVEETLADVIFSANERFFLIEVKAKQGRIRDEWIRKQGTPK